MVTARYQAADTAHARGVLLVLLAGVFWSIGGIVVRLLEVATEWHIIFYRSLALAIMLLIVIAIRGRGAIAQTFRAAGWTAVVGGFALSIAFTAFIFSMTHTTIANSVFLLSVAPFLAALLGRIVLGERVRRGTWVAMAVAIVGVGIMVGEGAAVGSLFGILAGLTAALGFSVCTVALRRGRNVDMTPTICLAGLFAVPVAAAMIMIEGQRFAIPMHDLQLCLMLGVVQVGCGLLAFTAGSRHVPSAELALLSLTEIVLAPIWVFIGVGEVPSTLTLLGGAIVLGAICARALSGLRRSPDPVGIV